MSKLVLFADDDADADATRQRFPYRRSDNPRNLPIDSDVPNFDPTRIGVGNVGSSQQRRGKANFETLIKLNFMAFDGSLEGK